jgi:hypothetical protein
MQFLKGVVRSVRRPSHSILFWGLRGGRGVFLALVRMEECPVEGYFAIISGFVFSWPIDLTNII